MAADYSVNIMHDWLLILISIHRLVNNYLKAETLKLIRNFTMQSLNLAVFKTIDSIGRHKIMNPDKMRNTYGKLVYLLQDSQIPEVKEMLNFNCVSSIKTVYSVLEVVITFYHFLYHFLV